MINTEQKAKLLSKKLGKYKKIGNEYLYSCFNKNCNSVKKNKYKLSINFSKNLYKCWVCNWSGSITRLINKFKEDRNFIQDWKELDSSYISRDFSDLFSKEEIEVVEEKPTLPENFISLVKNDSIIVKQALSYLRSREFSKEDIEFYKPGICLTGEYEGRIIFPSFDSEGELNFFTSRSYTNHQISYKKCHANNKNIIFNELYVNWDQPIVLVEGIFDAIKLGNMAIPMLGSCLDQSFKLFREIVRHSPIVYLALDPDVEEKAIKIAKNLIKYDVMIYKVNISPYKDLGEMSKQEAQKRLLEASFLNNNMLLTSLYSILGTQYNGSTQ